jgi:hypothetical protein
MAVTSTFAKMFSLISPIPHIYLLNQSTKPTMWRKNAGHLFLMFDP